MKQQSVGHTSRMILMTAAAFCLSCYAVSSQAQVYYPATPEYHSALVTNPILSGTALPYATPISPVQSPTIPPNAAFGLEHQSAYVVPTPRVITQRKMGLAPAVGVAPAIVDNPMVSEISTQSTVVAPQVMPNAIMSQPVMTTSSAPFAYAPSESELLEQHPGAAYTRFFTTVPTTTYSDELPLIVSVMP